MRCPVQNGENSEILLDYCARRLNPEMVAVLERHMKHCPECEQFAATQQQVWKALDGWEVESVPADFDARLYARIEIRDRQGWLRRLWGDSFAWKPALPVAAACATAALAFLLNFPAKVPVGGPQWQDRPRIEALEADQIESTLEDVDMLRQFSTPGPGSSQSL